MLVKNDDKTFNAAYKDGAASRETSSIGLDYDGHFQNIGQEDVLPNDSVQAWKICAEWINQIVNNPIETLEWETVYADMQNAGGEKIYAMLGFDIQEKYIIGFMKKILGGETDYYEVIINFNDDYTDWENITIKQSNATHQNMANFENGTKEDLVLNSYSLLTLNAGGEFESLICYDFDANRYMVSDGETPETAKDFLLNEYAAELGAVESDTIIAFVGEPVRHQVDFNVEAE